MSRVFFLEEPPNVEPAFRGLTRQLRPNPKNWADAYLAAFAIVSGMQLVTFDRALHGKVENLSSPQAVGTSHAPKIKSPSLTTCNSIHPSSGNESTGRRFCHKLKRRRSFAGRSYSNAPPCARAKIPSLASPAATPVAP